VAGAAVGGDVTITAGAAARLTSGNANGGNIALAPGAGIGTGTAGYVSITASGTIPILVNASATTTGISFNGTAIYQFTNGSLRAVTSTSAFQLNQPHKISWGSGAADGTQDTGIVRDAAGIVQINNATTGQWGALKAGTRDSGTNTVTNGLTLGHQSTGTPAAGLGIAIALNINSTTTADQNAALISALWNVATDATRAADLVLSAYNTTNAREGLRIRGGASAALIGLYGATPVVQPSAITAPTGGATVDTEARAAIVSILNAIGAGAGGIGITA
jgi:hypothetical protein